MSAHMSGDRSFQLLEVGPDRLEASPATLRRRWSAEAKARLVQEALDADANVSAIARRNGLSPAQLFGWRRQAMRSGAVQAQGQDDGPVRFARFDAMSAGMVEIVVGEVVIRVGADVGAEHLVRVMRAVRSA